MRSGADETSRRRPPALAANQEIAIALPAGVLSGVAADSITENTSRDRRTGTVITIYYLDSNPRSSENSTVQPVGVALFRFWVIGTLPKYQVQALSTAYR